MLTHLIFVFSHILSLICMDNSKRLVIHLYYKLKLWHLFLTCRSYENPVKVSDERLEAACREFTCGILSALKSPSLSPVYINLDLDIWHYATYKRGTASKHQGHFLFSKQDVCRLKYLPIHW